MTVNRNKKSFPRAKFFRLLCDAVCALLPLPHGFTDGRGLLATAVRPVHAACAATQTEDRTEDRGTLNCTGLLVAANQRSVIPVKVTKRRSQLI